jgi:hypothetical protein
MLLFEIADIVVILLLWGVVPLVTIRMIVRIRASLPRWELAVMDRIKRLALVCLIIAVPIVALYVYVFLADRKILRRWFLSEGEYETTRVVRRLRRVDRPGGFPEVGTRPPFPLPTTWQQRPRLGAARQAQRVRLRGPW